MIVDGLTQTVSTSKFNVLSREYIQYVLLH